MFIVFELICWDYLENEIKTISSSLPPAGRSRKKITLFRGKLRKNSDALCLMTAGLAFFVHLCTLGVKRNESWFSADPNL